MICTLPGSLNRDTSMSCIGGIMLIIFMPRTVFEKQVFISTIGRKSYCSYSEAWKNVAPSICHSERSCVSPGLTIDLISAIKRPKANSYCLRHGSFAGIPDAAASFFMSKPVILGVALAIVNCRRVRDPINSSWSIPMIRLDPSNSDLKSSMDETGGLLKAIM